MSALGLGRGLTAVSAAALIVAACASAPTAPPPTPLPAATAPATPTAALPSPTASPAPTLAPLPTGPPATVIAPTPAAEERVVELEWPPRMRLGESDVIRLALIPSEEGYVVTTEFPEHQAVTTLVPVPRPGGYDLSAIARLDGVGFRISPEGDQAQGVPLDAPATWRWTITPRAAGQQRPAITLRLRWTPQAGQAGRAREAMVYSKALDVRVTSFLGLTAAQAAATGIAGLALGGVLSLPLAAYLLRPRRPRSLLQILTPNAGLVIEQHPAVGLSPQETDLLRTLFRRYARITVEAEFRSGYSGARTFLILPVRGDGRADAHTIAKLGERGAIQREFENYEAFVKDTLPPITARIQERPVATPDLAAGAAASDWGGRAALRYTFIGESGHTPASLRESLLADPDPSRIEKLFETFGPNWWMQRRPHTFRLAQEYDRLLPAHYVLEPATAKAHHTLDGREPPAGPSLPIGGIAAVRNLRPVERRADGQSLSLIGERIPGHPPLRVRWLGLTPPAPSPSLLGARLWSRPANATARVVATRETLLRDFASGFDLGGLPDPLTRLPGLLAERIIGTQSTIHGDLNLENVLIGPGGFVWLIDFARTRDGHPLFDFAHLEADVVAHVIAPQVESGREYVALLRGQAGAPAYSLRAAIQSVAARCLFNSRQPREYHLALFAACVGALKYANLGPHQKHLLYLTAAHLAETL